MWFKQATLYQCQGLPTQPEMLAKQLQSLAFTPCLPTLPITQGWISPEQDEHASLVHSVADVWRICLQFEEKVLPPKVVRQALQEEIQRIEKTEDRRVRQKEKYALKDDIIHTLLPRAFSQLTRVDAYIDREHGYLVIDSAHEKNAQCSLNVYKRL